MSTEPSVPGVYIEEDASPAISVSLGATAVPLFIARFTPLDNQYAGVITRISSWLDFCQKFSASDTVSASVGINSEPDNKENPGKYTYSVSTASIAISTSVTALQLYFQNGGNACYIYPLNDSKDKDKLAALPALADKIGDITLFAVPEGDSNYQETVYGALIESLDKSKGYFLLADSASGKVPAGISNSDHVAVYYPKLLLSARNLPAAKDSDVAISGYVNITPDKTASTLKELIDIDASTAALVSSYLEKAMPAMLDIEPSALMAGVYCKVDRERGVWKAPANVVLSGVSDVSVRVTDDEQQAMNQAGINVIRYFSDRGSVVWGARTLLNDDNWRYIPVRRLFDAAERDIKKAMQPMVFEPNNQLTWKRAQTAIEHYLYRLWQQGGLSGNKA